MSKPRLRHGGRRANSGYTPPRCLMPGDERVMCVERRSGKRVIITHVTAYCDLCFADFSQNEECICDATSPTHE
jgi:hypothetical protein